MENDSRAINHAIEGKLYLGQGCIPHLRTVPRNTAYYGTQRAINYFSFSISLWVANATEVQGSIKFLPQHTPKMTQKLYIAIQSDGFRNAMEPQYLLKENVCYIDCISSFLARDKLGHFGESIYYNKHIVFFLLS